MNRLRGTKLIIPAPYPLTSQEHLNQWLRECGIDGTLEGLRNVVAAIEGRNGVNQEQLRLASELVESASHQWQQMQEGQPFTKGSLAEIIISAFTILCEESAEAGFSLSDMGEEFKRSQSNKAQKSRNPILKKMVAQLAKRPRWEWKPRDLWPEIISLFDRAGMDPEEKGNSAQPDTWKITYTVTCTDGKDKTKSLSFRRFENLVSEARNK